MQRLPNMGNESVYLSLESTIIGHSVPARPDKSGSRCRSCLPRCIGEHPENRDLSGETAPTKHGERKCLSVFRIHYSSFVHSFISSLITQCTNEQTVFTFHVPVSLKPTSSGSDRLQVSECVANSLRCRIRGRRYPTPVSDPCHAPLVGNSEG